MTDVKRLLDRATPLPWREADWPAETDADAALIVYAVNRLPDYEAAVDALVGLVPWLHRGYTLMNTNPETQDEDPTPLQDAALAALRRFGKDPTPR